MERAVCEQCGAFQPGDWVAGHLCVACGGAVRREARCAWCAKWIPASRFCRVCGCEVVGPELYGAARMLKRAGVDRFSLIRRLKELDPEQTLNLGRIYNAQLGVVARRVDEVRLCERYLLQRSFSKRVEEELVARLPMEEEELAAFEGESSEALERIAERSPLRIARELSSIALLRLGRFEGTSTACDALRSDDPELAQEAAAGFAHWRFRLCRHAIDERALRAAAASVPRGSPLRPWAAVAMVLVRRGDYGVVDPEMPEWVGEELAAGLTAGDPDLRFACAMALGECGIVARGLDSRDGQQRVVARTFLAVQRSPELAPLLREGSEEVCAEILDRLRPPLPDALLEPVLEAVDRAGPGSRAQGVRLLQPSFFNEPMVVRLTRIAQREGDVEMFEELLRSERLPGGSGVVRAVMGAGLLEELYGALSRAAAHIDFTDEAVSRLAESGDPAVLRNLIELAGNQLDEVCWNEGTILFLARILFTAPSEIRVRAHRVLEAHRQPDRDWLSAAATREPFGDRAGFINAALRLLADEEIAPMCVGLIDRHWAELAGALAAERGLVERLSGALRRLADYPGVEACRRESARLLVKVAVNFPAVALPEVAALLRANGTEWDYRDIPADLLAEYDALARRIGSDESLAAELALGLAALFPHASLNERYLPAIELMTKLAQEHPALRQGMMAQIASDLEERNHGDPELRPPLKALAAAVGFVPAAEEQAAPLPAPEDLDHLEVLPEAPLKTLAQYVAFLQAMSGATDPASVLANYGMDQVSFGGCLSQWSEVLAGDDALALRCSELMGSEP